MCMYGSKEPTILQIDTCNFNEFFRKSVYSKIAFNVLFTIGKV